MIHLIHKTVRTLTHHTAIGVSFFLACASTSVSAQEKYPNTTVIQIVTLADIDPATGKNYDPPSPPPPPSSGSSIPQVPVTRPYLSCASGSASGGRIYNERCGWSTFQAPDFADNLANTLLQVPTEKLGDIPYTLNKDCLKALEKQNRADFKSITKNEERKNKGYALWSPSSPKNPKSGVTISVGIDLSKRTEAELVSWGVSPEGIRIVKPFVNKNIVGAAAYAALKAQGKPMLGEADIEAMAKGGFNWTYDTVSRNFDNNNKVGLTFAELPAELQTSIVDLAYPFGPYLNISRDSVWSLLLEGRLAEAANAMPNNVPKQHVDRMLENYARILSALKTGKAPSVATGKCK